MINEQSEFAQPREVARDVRLRRAYRMSKSANAQLIVLHQQHDAAQAGFVG